MKRLIGVVLLVFLVSCSSSPPVIVEEVEEVPIVEPVVEQVRESPPARLPSRSVSGVLLGRDIRPYSLVSMSAGFDKIGIVPAERYDAKYTVSIVDVNATVLLFSTRHELDFVLDSAFDDVLRYGAQKYGENIIMMFLSDDDHRIAAWSHGDMLIIIDTSVADFAAREVVDAYINKYPSDLLPKSCIDTDGANRYEKGFTTQVLVGGMTAQWTDVCYRDAVDYHSKKGLTQADGLLEGRCSTTDFGPGFVEEYACAKGCHDGKCVLR